MANEASATMVFDLDTAAFLAEVSKRAALHGDYERAVEEVDIKKFISADSWPDVIE